MYTVGFIRSEIVDGLSARRFNLYGIDHILLLHFSFLRWTWYKTDTILLLSWWLCGFFSLVQYSFFVPSLHIIWNQNVLCSRYTYTPRVMQDIEFFKHHVPDSDDFLADTLCIINITYHHINFFFKIVIVTKKFQCFKLCEIRKFKNVVFLYLTYFCNKILAKYHILKLYSYYFTYL